MPHCNFAGFTTADLEREGSRIDAVFAAEAGRLTWPVVVHDLTLRGSFTFVPNSALVERMREMASRSSIRTGLRRSPSRSPQSAGVTGTATDNISALRIFKVDAAYVRDMDALGYPNLPADKFVALKVQGVDPDEVRQCRALAYQPDADQLIQIRILRIAPDVIWRMQVRGLGSLTFGKLVQIRIFKLAD
jgi:hypothetical protein